MTLNFIQADESIKREWDEFVVSSPHGTIFHTWSWLKIVEDHTRMKYLPLIAYRGADPVALYPIFIRKVAIFNTAYSPPPGAYLLYLGPVIIDYHLKKQDKKESVFKELQEEIDRYLFENLRCKYARIRLSPGLSDSRPLRWCGYTPDPLYTYRINLSSGTEAVWQQFDRKLRVGINRAIKEGITVREGSKNDLMLIEDDLLRRRKEQGIKSPDHSKYLMDLFDKYKENMIIFLAYHQEKIVGNLVALKFKDIMYLWIGTPKSSLRGIYPNDLVQWEAIQRACRDGLHWFENMDGGDNPRLTVYKSKYNPEPVIWFSAEKYSSFLYKAGVKIIRRSSSN